MDSVNILDKKKIAFSIRIYSIALYLLIELIYLYSVYRIVKNDTIYYYLINLLGFGVATACIFVLTKKWLNGYNKGSYARELIRYLFIIFILSNLIRVLFEFLFRYNTIDNLIAVFYILFTCASLISLSLIVACSIITRNMPIEIKTTDFFISLYDKLIVVPFFTVFLVASILVSNSLFLRQELTQATVTEKFEKELLAINLELSEYLSSLSYVTEFNSELISSIYQVNGNITEEKFKDIFENNMLKSSLNDSLQFKEVYVSINSNFTGDKLPLYFKFT